MTRILIFEYLTGGGLDSADHTLLPMGLAMRDAMVGDLLRSGLFSVGVACGHGVPLPPHEGAAVLRCADRASLFEWVARQAALHDAVWLVAPETDQLLARFAQAVPAARWIGCDAQAIGIASSKSATLACLAAHGVTTPLAFHGAASRWIVKPDDGAGAVDTTLYTGHEAAQAAMRRGHRSAMTLEPWVDGDALSLSLSCAADHAELLSINRQRIAIEDDGRLRYDGVDIDTVPLASAEGRRLAALATRVHAAIAGLRGFVGIDVVWHAARGPVVIEVNPRLTCAYVGLSARLQRNLAAEFVSAHGQALHEAA
jgi:tyramine---L-glutamate ligase